MNRERILRDLEYVCGGMTTLREMCDKENKSQKRYYDLLDDWIDVLYNVIGAIGEDEYDASKYQGTC